MSDEIYSPAYDPNPSHPTAGSGSNPDVPGGDAGAGRDLVGTPAWTPPASSGDWVVPNRCIGEDVDYSMPGPDVIQSPGEMPKK